jgi:hypothetical protein
MDKSRSRLGLVPFISSHSLAGNLRLHVREKKEMRETLFEAFSKDKSASKHESKGKKRRDELNKIMFIISRMECRPKIRNDSILFLALSVLPRNFVHLSF